jgi:hypothetical protein
MVALAAGAHAEAAEDEASKQTVRVLTTSANLRESFIERSSLV